MTKLSELPEIKLYNEADFFQSVDVVTMALHCAALAEGAPVDDGVSPLHKFCTSREYDFLVESMMGKVMW
jgi:hypothetical protein